MSSSLKRSPLYDAHIQAGARMVDFGGWEMPLNYGSQLEEHHAVRRDCGMFDVSHMLNIDVAGPDAKIYLQRLLANDVARLRVLGKALYSCLLNPEGGVIDDLIVYFFGDSNWRLVVNAATADNDVEWMQRVASQNEFDLTITPRRDLAMLAVQGPNAREKVWAARPAWKTATEGLPPFCATFVDEVSMVSRTGYTGEDGYEIVLPAALIASLWKDLALSGVAPCGLGARDTLRLEAGMNLYGQDMDESVHPMESGLGWTVSLDDTERQFIGRDALEGACTDRHLVGLTLLDKGVMRSHMAVSTDSGEGEVTSGTLSPTLGVSIAMARVPNKVRPGDTVQVQMRGKWLPAQVTQMPFIRRNNI